MPATSAGSSLVAPDPTVTKPGGCSPPRSPSERADPLPFKAGRYTERRRNSHRVSPSRATETSTSQPASIHWKVQYRLSGW